MADKTYLEIDEKQIFYRQQNGVIRTMLWSELRTILVETNSDGPFLTDVYWILAGDNGGCVVPMETEGEEELLKHLQQLQGFRNEVMIEAMTCVEERRFICWQRSADT